MPRVLSPVLAITLAVALAACAGLRAWLPLLLAGALSRAGWLQLGDSFQLMGSNKALALFAVATAIELIGDKIPAVDHALDALSTVLRPAAGAMLAASVFGRIADPLESAALGVAVGAPVALIPHAGKTVLRAASSALTARRQSRSDGGPAVRVMILMSDMLQLVVVMR